jgi:SAM-dependent methyltransferase
MLEIGTGTGIAAMLGARCARHVWATDITERSTRFAEFNRRLYGLENMTVAMGDLFAPVEGLTFDRIVIHPPYVPAKKSTLVFRDSGQDGEQIIRRTIEELPRFLRPGGRFYSLQMATDREGETFEQRVRKWLGERAAEFDLALGARSMQAPPEFLGNLAFAGRVDTQNIEALLEMWKATKTVAMVYGALVIERHGEDRQAITRRAQAGNGYSGRDLERLLEWEQQMSRPENAERLLASKPALAPGCEVHTTSRIVEGRLCAEQFSFAVRGPFRTRAGCDAGLAQVLVSCDGAQTCRELYTRARNSGWIPRQATPEEFARMLASFAGEGVLRMNC